MTGNAAAKATVPRRAKWEGIEKHECEVGSGVFGHNGDCLDLVGLIEMAGDAQRHRPPSPSAETRRLRSDYASCRGR